MIGRNTALFIVEPSSLFGLVCASEAQYDGIELSLVSGRVCLMLFVPFLQHMYILSAKFSLFNPITAHGKYGG